MSALIVENLLLCSMGMKRVKQTMKKHGASYNSCNYSTPLPVSDNNKGRPFIRVAALFRVRLIVSQTGS